jgi:hypothetical protein
VVWRKKSGSSIDCYLTDVGSSGFRMRAYQIKTLRKTATGSQREAQSSGCLNGFIQYAVEVSTPLMIQMILSSGSSLCFHDSPEQRKSCCADCGRLFLAESGGTVVLELLVECVTVTDGGDVVAFKT